MTEEASDPTTIAHAWRLIEIAPRDGSYFLALFPNGDVYKVSFIEGFDANGVSYPSGFYRDSDVEPCFPTHWYPEPVLLKLEAEVPSEGNKTPEISVGNYNLVVDLIKHRYLHPQARDTLLHYLSNSNSDRELLEVVGGYLRLRDLRENNMDKWDDPKWLHQLGVENSRLVSKAREIYAKYTEPKS